MENKNKRVSSFSERLKTIMDLKGIRGSTLAKELNVHKSLVYRYLNGEVIPLQDRLDQIANYFHITHGWLMGYDCEMYQNNNTRSLIIDALKDIDDEETLMQIYLYIKKLLKKD